MSDDSPIDLSKLDPSELADLAEAHRRWEAQREAELVALARDDEDEFAALDETDQLMQEAPVADNHGRRTPSRGQAKDADEDSPSESEDGTPLGDSHIAARNLMWESNDSMTRIPGHTKDGTYFGMKAHRGLLTEREEGWVNYADVRALALQYLGSTDTEMLDLYGPGAPPPERVARRAVIDERLLQLHEDGSPMWRLAKALNWQVREDFYCRKMAAALSRARKARA